MNSLKRGGVLAAGRGVVVSALGLALLCLLAGCATAPGKSRPTQQPVRSFPPVELVIVRLPVEVVFPDGGDVFEHLSLLFKGGLKQFMPDLSGMPNIRTEPYVTDLWKIMQEPIFLDNDLWLLIRPRTLGVGMLRTDLKRATTARMVLQMTAQPEIVLGPKPRTTAIPIPPLHPFQPGPAIFRAMSTARFSYDEANEYFRKPDQKLIGRVLSKKGERKLTVAGIRFYGSKGRVAVEVKVLYDPPILNLSGHPSKLTIHLWGTPRYLPKRRVFDLPDLDFDIKSGNLLVNIASWINKSHFRNEMRKFAEIPVGLKLDWMKGRVDLALNRPLGRFTRLKTQVGSLKVWDAVADEEGIEIRYSIQGTALLEVIWN